MNLGEECNRGLGSPVPSTRSPETLCLNHYTSQLSRDLQQSSQGMLAAGSRDKPIHQPASVLSWHPQSQGFETCLAHRREFPKHKPPQFVTSFSHARARHKNCNISALAPQSGLFSQTQTILRTIYVIFNTWLGPNFTLPRDLRSLGFPQWIQPRTTTHLLAETLAEMAQARISNLKCRFRHIVFAALQ